MKKYVTILIVFLTISSFSQTRDLPRNAKAGKCYKSFSFQDFNYKETFKGDIWKEVDCTKLNETVVVDDETNKKILLKKYKDKLKFKKYKEKLVRLGYKLKTSESIDRSFVKAHNKYLKKKKRAERKFAQNNN